MEHIKEMRAERGVTQAALAAAAGMDPATLNRIEQGKANPNVKTLEKLARALDVEVADFFPKAQAPLPLNFEPSAGLGMQSIARMRAELLEELADLWGAQLDRGQYDAGTLMAMDLAGFVLALNHSQEEEFIKHFLSPDQVEQLERAETRLVEHDEKIHSVMLRMQGQVVEMKPYLAQRDAQREEARREISGTA